MRFFKHGDALAIALPDSLRKKLNLMENNEYEFVEIEEGILALVKKEKLASLVSEKVQPFLRKTSTPNVGAWTSQGYLVLEDENQAKSFSQQFEKLIKAGEIRGVRGFDKRFYVATADFYAAASEKIVVGLKDKPKTAAELAKEISLPLQGCLTTLYLLKEEGEVLEKKRGEFSLVR